MRPESVFLPVSVLALWTMLVLILVGARRVLAVRSGRVPRSAFRFGEAPGVPDDVVAANRNFMNLLETPVLFYVAVIAFYITHRVTPGTVTLAWVFVALRLVHSFIQLTSNHIMHRFFAFVASNVVLATLWIRFVLALV